MPTRKDRPREPAPASGRWLALSLALAVHAAFIAVLVFSIRWQNREPAAVTAELYAPSSPARVPAAEPPVAPPLPVPPPPPVPQPPPEPAPAPRPAPAPAPVRKPEPVVEKPDPRTADIALKAKAEAERRKRAEAEREKRERELKEAQKREAESRKQDEQKRLAEARERQAREAEALKAQAARERQTREAEALKAQAARERQTREAEALKAQAAREAEALKAQAAREGELRAAQQAAAVAGERARADYIARIQAKVKGNINEPGDIPGNLEAIFSVVQLPTGEIIDVKLVKSSGLRAYDDAVERAIRKSSPLPRPDRPELWTRVLQLKVRPRD